MKYTIEKVTTLIGAHRYGHSKADIEWLLTDSRSLCLSEGTLFFALRSERNDGHKYIPDLYRRGVRNFVVSDLPTQWNADYPDANFLKVGDTRIALQRLAERHRDAFDIPIVGITGSNGKTVVKEWIYQLLSPVKRVTRSPRSYNSQVGVPLSVWLLDEMTEVGLFEAGISEPGEMSALRHIIQPTVAVITSIGPAHQENFPTLEDKVREKLRLTHDARYVVYCADDELLDRMVKEECPDAEILSWSLGKKEARYQVTKMEKSDNQTLLEYVCDGQKNAFVVPFIDEASIHNSMTCAVVARLLGVDNEQLNKGMALLEPVAMRMEVKEGQRGCTLINDSYNSDINSLFIALDFMNRRPDHRGRKRTLIISDILQSGVPVATLYSRVAELAQLRDMDKIIGIGPQISACAELFNIADKSFFHSVDDFLDSETFNGLHDEVILLKGARAFGFERITDRMVQKVHETTLEVNLKALVANLNHFRSFLKPGTRLACMIKANGYGAGAVEIAKTLQEHRVDYMAVAVADEGVTLRKNGITGNIMVMNPEMSSFHTLFDYELEPEVYSFRLLDALIAAARKEGITNYPVHIKLDTGMHRLGFDPEKDIEKLISRLTHQNELLPRSVFSHFVGSDSDDFDNFSKQQFERFVKGSRLLQEAFPHTILRHINNSAGIEHFPERQLDMCRLGLGLYGVDSRDNSIIHNVCSLHTTILQLRKVPKEETVGYSRKGHLERDSVIAAIPIGYADGLDRHLGRGRGYCLVNGQKAPYVGNICMDVAMIDVTDIDCQEGDRVEIFGDNLPVTVLSDLLDTIPYEVLTAVSERVKRIYFQD